MGRGWPSGRVRGISACCCKMRPSANRDSGTVTQNASAASSRFTIYISAPRLVPMSKKSAKIAALIEAYSGEKLDAHYLGYFQCFNLGLFYEAHDVLEELWLSDRQGTNGAFYKGLIQFAGAFVHLKRGRLRPAAALFKPARASLR